MEYKKFNDESTPKQTKETQEKHRHVNEHANKFQTKKKMFDYLIFDL